MNTGYTFDDVILCPQYSDIPSRNDPSIDLSTELVPGYELKIPIITAPMDSITGRHMAKAMSQCGGAGIIHRFHSQYKERAYDVYDTHYGGHKPAIMAIGLNDLYNIDEMMDYEGGCPILCIDVAHGHTKQVIDMIGDLKRRFPKCQVIAGSIATYEAASDLIDAGADCLRVGIGGGSLCTTRIVTGHGVPQLKAIAQAKTAIVDKKSECKLIADGGIRNSGDIVKALAIGADTVMLGRLVAGADEAPGQLSPDERYKLYRGQSSQNFMDEIGKTDVTAEGESTWVLRTGPVIDTITKLVGGIRSGFTYSGARTILELQIKAKMILVTQNGLAESHPHAIR